MSIRTFQRSRLMVGVTAILSLVLLAALIVAALSVRAESNEPTVTSDFLIGDDESGNEFPDDFRAQYQIKFGEADSGKLGMRRNHVVNVHDGSDIRMLSLTFDPDAVIRWHTHPGPLAVGIAEGALTVTWSSDCEPRTYEAGEAFVDLGEDVHMAENLSGETTVVYITAIGIPDGDPVSHVHDVDPC